jgi:hypothetical protein
MPVRASLAFLVSLGGLFLVAALRADGLAAMLLWLAVGAAAGAVAQRAARVPVVWVAGAAFVPMSMALGLTTLVGRLQLVGVLVTIGLIGLPASIGFFLGSRVGWRGGGWSDARRAWLEVGRGARWAAVAGVLAVLVGLCGYTAYVGVAGSDAWLSVGVDQDCRTPAFAFGWTYEAINYDPADDANLAPRQVDPAGGTYWTCASQGTAAGSELRTTDGVSIAGWYVPAASGAGPDGPTLLIVPGGKSNKSGMLKYALPFHDAFNLAFLDDRGMGRSGPGAFSFGLYEKLDVEAMVDWLVAAKGPSWIGALGDSLGAETALAEAAEDQRIRALILDSMHARAVDVAGNIMANEWGLPAQPGAWAIVTAASLRLGGDVSSVDPETTIQQIGERPVLLIHGTADVLDVPAQSAERNLHAALDAGVPVELHYCRGGTHGTLVDDPACAADWSRWARSFLDGALARAGQ